MKTISTLHDTAPSTHAAHAAQTAAAAQEDSAARLNLYGGIHKALRLMLSDTLTRVGTTDLADGAQVRESLNRVHALVKMFAGHIEHENRFMHPALERAQPGASARIAAEHGAHDDHLEALSDLALVADLCPAGDREAAWNRLYHALALFMADNLEHMHYEETEHNAVLWAHYTDAELMDLHDELVASIAPDEMMNVMFWMLPAVNATERALMLGDMRQKAPAPAFKAVMDLARTRLSANDWAALTRELHLPASEDAWARYGEAA
jgi:hypothetical protein